MGKLSIDQEKRLEVVAKSLLASPHKPRDESKIGKPTSKAKKSPKPKKKPSR
jgi:hypothetical protein